MSTVSEPKSKPCNRCGEQIIWNNNSHFFESLKIPKFQHCCPIKCTTEGCGGTIYFSNLCPVHPETGKKRPLDYPIPVVDPNNSAQMIWKLHVHLNKSTVPATETPAQPPATTVPETKPLAPGQETLVANIPAADTGVSAKNPIAQSANQDVNATILSTLNDINQRLASLEKYASESLVPVVAKMTEVLENTIPKLNVIAGKIADGSIKSASDLVEHHLNT